MRVAHPVSLTPEERQTLEQQARARSLPARQVERARIVLLAADGWRDKQIAVELGIGEDKASRWRKRFLGAGLAGLAKDAPRPQDHSGKGRKDHRQNHARKARGRYPLEHPHHGRCSVSVRATPSGPPWAPVMQ